MRLFSKLFKRKSKGLQLSSYNLNNLVCLLPFSKSIKLNTKIQVPENFCVVVSSKSKLLDILPAGEFELTGITIPKTLKANKMDKPTKKGYKEEFEADFYFVNQKLFTLQNNFYINKLKQKIEFNLDIKITNPNLFLKFLFDEKVVFDNDFALDELTFYTSQLIYYYFLDNKLLTKENLSNYLENKLTKIGVKSNNLKINYFDNNIDVKNNDIHDNNLTNTDDQILTSNNQQNSNNQSTTQNPTFTKTSLVNLDDITTENISYFVCDNCGVKLPQNAKYCFNCKKSFIEKNLCENCGRVIPSGVYVCPYCNSVILN